MPDNSPALLHEDPNYNIPAVSTSASMLGPIPSQHDNERQADPLLGAVSSAWHACGREPPMNAEQRVDIDPDEIRATSNMGAAAAAVRQVISVY